MNFFPLLACTHNRSELSNQAGWIQFTDASGEHNSMVMKLETVATDSLGVMHGHNRRGFTIAERH